MSATVSLALGLVRAHQALDSATTGPARKEAAAFLNGMCDAAHRLGFGMTPQHVRMATQDALRSAQMRPAFHPGSRSSAQAVRAWDHEVAAFLAEVLDATR